jgi:hypothetical protein
MKQRLLFWIVFLCVFQHNAQQRFLSFETFYKEKFILNSGKKSIETFYPANESQLNLHDLIKDTTKQYLNLSEYLFKHPVFQLNKEGASLMFHPFLHISKGMDNFDSTETSFPLFRNTRGVFVEGQYNKIAFNFAFAENQAGFQDYESSYFNSRGELYVRFEGYSLQNAVIPGGSRTKPFKEGAYDYAFSFGNIRFAFSKKVELELGNNQHFIGNGYRSLLLSDNASYAPYVRFNWQIHPKWRYQILYKKQLNLIRKPITYAVESSYETKIFAASYLTYKPIESLSISLFSGGNQLRDDSLVKKSFHPEQILPLPLFQNDLLLNNSSSINGITGLNIDYARERTRWYGQIVVDKFGKQLLIAHQLGCYIKNPKKINNTLLQIEWNSVPQNFYASSDHKLSYSHFNLPSAHPKGNNFNELFLKLGTEFYKRFYVSAKSSTYFTKGGTLNQQFEANSIFTSVKPSLIKNGYTVVGALEVGWRFNKLYNGIVYVTYGGRAVEYGKLHPTNNYLLIGLKTSLINEYFDF